MAFSKQDAAALSEDDRSTVNWAISRISKGLKKGNRTFAQDILEPDSADSPDKVRDAILEELGRAWTIEFKADNRDGNYYLFS